MPVGRRNKGRRQKARQTTQGNQRWIFQRQINVGPNAAKRIEHSPLRWPAKTGTHDLRQRAFTTHLKGQGFVGVPDRQCHQERGEKRSELPIRPARGDPEAGLPECRDDPKHLLKVSKQRLGYAPRLLEN